MDELLAALIRRDRPASLPMWRSFWDRLHAGRLRRGEAAAVLASLSTRAPCPESLTTLLRSLEERKPPVAVRFPGAVNIVGTGGGPQTFNVSTAAAFAAAAMGVPVIKTGSRAYSGRCGSMDLLGRLGVPLTTSYEQTAAMLGRFGIAFAGYFVYPAELALLARGIVPLDMRVLGGFINSFGPFLAAMPVSAQLTGVSDHSLLPGLRHLASQLHGRTVWLCTNDLGADELLSFTSNVIRTNDGSGDSEVSGPALGLDRGGVTGVRQPAGLDAAEYVLAVLAGQGGPVATQTVCLNAAALAVMSGVIGDWPKALAAAQAAISDGAVTGLLSRLRERQHGTSRRQRTAP